MAAEVLPHLVDPEEALDDRRARLRLVADRVAPMALARERTLPVLPALENLLPAGALRRGSVVSVDGMGATSLALALAAGPSAAGSWTAVVGRPELGLAAAEEAGIALERLLVVSAEPAVWANTVSALIGSVDVVLVAPRHRVRDGDARRLAARLRERGSVLIHTGGRWAPGADVQLDVARSEWGGLGCGHGVLRSRRVVIDGGGRGAAARPRSTELFLPDPAGSAARVDSAGGDVWVGIG